MGGGGGGVKYHLIVREVAGENGGAQLLWAFVGQRHWLWKAEEVSISARSLSHPGSKPPAGSAGQPSHRKQIACHSLVAKIKCG